MEHLTYTSNEMKIIKTFDNHLFDCGRVWKKDIIGILDDDILNETLSDLEKKGLIALFDSKSSPLKGDGFFITPFGVDEYFWNKK